MSDLDKEILSAFVEESNSLALRLGEILEVVEGDLSQSSKLEEYGNLVDRMMGGAQSLSLQLVNCKPLILIGDISALCKAVSYKAAQVKNNPSLVEISVALLLDATEILEEVLDGISESTADPATSETELKKHFSPHFIERLRWVSSQFSADLRGTVGTTIAKPNAQNEIDDLLKKFGLG